MKKILKFGALITVIAPISLVVSCGSEETPKNNPPKINEREVNIEKSSNTLEQNQWIDDQVNTKTDIEYIEHEESTTSEKYWDDGHSNSTYRRNGWTYYEKQLAPELYSKEIISRDFAFMNNNLTEEVHTFISNVFKYDQDMSILGLSPEYTHMNNNAHTKTIMVFDEAIKGETGPRRLYMTTQFMTTNVSAGATQGKTNAETAYFKAPQVGFNPSFVTSNAKTIAGTDVLWNAVRGNKNYASYNAKYNIETYKDNNYLALKLLAGNLDLSPSQLYEVVSASFMEISAIKKQEFVKLLAAKNYKVVLHGVDHGAMDNISTTLLKPSILDDVHSIYSAGESMHAAIDKEMEFSGKYSPNVVTQSNDFAIIEYIKIKYGLLKRLDTALKNQSFKQKFVNKTWMCFADKSIAERHITDFEKNFYTERGVKHLMIKETRSSLAEFFGPQIKYTPTQQQYVTNALREDASILDNPIYDWSPRSQTHTLGN